MAASSGYKVVCALCLYLLLFATYSHAVEIPAKVGAGQRLKTIIVNNYHPYTFLNDKGEPDGFSVDIAKAVAKAMDLELEIREDKWDVAMKELEAGSIDLLPMMAFSPDRDKLFDFSVPHTISYDAIFLKKGNNGIRSLKDLSGKKVIVMNKDAAHNYLVSSGLSQTMNLSLVDSLPDALNQLSAGKGDAAIMPKLVGIVTAKKLSLSGIETSPQLIDAYTRPFSFAAKNGNQALLERLNQGLNIIKKSGEYDAIYNKWFGAIEGTNIHRETVIKSASVVLVILLGLFVWNALLKRQVKAKTKYLEAEIAKRTTTEESLKVVTQRQSAILGSVPDILMEVDTNKVYTWANAAGLDFFGNDVLGKEASFYFEGEQNTYEVVQPLFIDSSDTIYVESWQRRKDGEIRLLAWWCKSILDEQGNVLGTLSSARDITESKMQEHKTERYIQLLNKTGNLAKVGGWELTLGSMELFWSDQTYRIHELNPDAKVTVEDAIGHYTPEARTIIQEAVNAAIESGTPFDLELQIYTAMKNLIWVRAQGEAEYLNGKIHKICGSFQDISERKKIEDIQSYLLHLGSNSENEDFFESLARYLADTLGMDYVCIDRLQGDCLSAETLAVYHDGKFEDNVEYTLKDTPCGDVVGKEICIFTKEVCSLFPNDPALQDLHAESYVGTTLWSFDMKPIGLIAVIGRKELSHTLFAEMVLKLVAIKAAGELQLRNVAAEKHKLEQQFQQTQKLESLGVLAGGIAHDFNNILAIIIGYCGLIKMDYETAENNITEIEKAAERAAGLCRQMLAYAGKAPLTKSQVNLKVLVSEMLTMLSSTLPQNTVIVPDLSVDIPNLTADATQIRQIIMNLIINASEAIGKEQGEIRISLGMTSVKADRAEMDYLGKDIPSGKYICLEVTDNGCGMDEETKWRIFEPFYTTKFTGRGLGMSAVLGIIKSHGGALQLFSRRGQGTTFKVYLPVKSNDSTGEVAEWQPVQVSQWQGSGTILLVEDEHQIRHIAKTLLANFGFTVLEAVNGKEALEIYKKNAQDIILVLTDIGMPVMDGYALFYELKMLDPKLPIIISSGFGEADVTSRIARRDIASVINKPYNPNQLREVLKSALGG